MINFELYTLMDGAVALAGCFRDELQPVVNVGRAIDLLLTPAPIAIEHSI